MGVYLMGQKQLTLSPSAATQQDCLGLDCVVRFDQNRAPGSRRSVPWRSTTTKR